MAQYFITKREKNLKHTSKTLDFFFILKIMFEVGGVSLHYMNEKQILLIFPPSLCSFSESE